MSQQISHLVEQQQCLERMIDELKAEEKLRRAKL
jgi:hypothetical protein